MSSCATLLWFAMTAGAAELYCPSGELESLWADLATTDPVKAHQTTTTLVARPEQAVPFLKQRLQPVPTPEPRRLTKLLAELDDERFEVRQRATRELEKLAETVEPALKKALAGDPS